MAGLNKEQLLATLSEAKAKSERDWLALTVTLNHALRRSETVAIKRDDISEGFIDIKRLKGSRRTVQPLIVSDNPLLNEREPLLAFIAEMHGNQTVFPISDRHLARLFTKYALAANVPKHLAHIHILKHTCGSQLIDEVGVNVTNRWMGHKNPANTLIYTQVSDDVAAPACAAVLSR
jgi:integrase